MAGEELGDPSRHLAHAVDAEASRRAGGQPEAQTRGKGGVGIVERYLAAVAGDTGAIEALDYRLSEKAEWLQVSHHQRRIRTGGQHPDTSCHQLRGEGAGVCEHGM